MSAPLTHTPAPWYVEDGTDIMAVDAKGHAELLATAYPMKRRTERAGEVVARHNARLIAAAPELLAILKEAMKALDEGDTYQGEVLEVIAEARYAIGRAEGGAR